MKPKEINIPYKFKDTLLYDLDLPVEEVSLSILENNMDICYLESEGTDDWNLSPRELIQNFDKEIIHAKRVEAVDLSYPICLYHFHGQWIILDGVHRFTKAMLQGCSTIKIKRIPENIIIELIKK